EDRTQKKTKAKGGEGEDEETELDMDEEEETEAADTELEHGDEEAAAEDAPPPEDEDEEEDSIDEGPKAPPAKVSKLTIALILLNWIAAPTFLIFAYLDYAERSRASYRTLLNYVQVFGLPLKCEEPGPKETYDPLARETRPFISLSPEQLHEAVKKGGAGTDGSRKVRKDAIEYAPFREQLIVE